MNEINRSSKDFFFFKKKFLIKIFKTSVLYKRFNAKITKFKRKTLMRWKHQTNWLVYTNVIRLWTKDYAFNRRYLRFQFYNKLFVTNFFLFNLNFSQMKNENYSYNCNFFFFTLIKATYKNLNNSLLQQFKNNNILFAYYLKTPVHDNSIVPVYSEWDGSLYPFTPGPIKSTFDFECLFDNWFLLTLNFAKEVNSVLRLLWYFHLNFKR